MMSSQQKQRPCPILPYRRWCKVNRIKDLVQSYHKGDDVKSTEGKTSSISTILAMMSSQQKQRPCPILPYRR
ncbi:hypothetical protein Bpfe_011957 [Biomphalaria pfeifferi]|uniref:Uncharacterized protein n=1 Tax=Biomphalaria pfeifferi TaxID=112525 RepID=A0AAD8BQE8_BIOPF|nr:hypothetical protein Bpfe_011954 [Biomphalaria pfeifferi]KAK0058650.1 hypothetical protein Bpfe_011955 [Biomphalaria pfeifferi]KAK0058651.1 hypothetical protein Bpfe_011956 [Biomphalaria pfeifferi]KAK0058652.1 hypothetical protein Bpfe_011957 [Biomphalaria pfeifferi]